MKLMAIDYGEKRVGVASTDESGVFALPRAVWANDENLLDKVVKFKSELEARGVTVLFHPEILTTLEARQLQGQTQMTDASAAALILKSYIDTVYNKDA